MLMTDDCGRLQNTLHRWRRCSHELRLSLEKIMACQSTSRYSFCPSDEHFQDWKQAMLKFNLTPEQIERLVLNPKGKVSVPSDISCRVLLLTAES